MIKIKRAKNGQLYYVVVAKNGKVLLTSETYKSKRGVWIGINAVLKSLRSHRSLCRIVDETQNK